jgi:hypothetical protein
MEKVNGAEKFDLFRDYWSPKVAAELNDSYIIVCAPAPRRPRY